ncbi:hypothetical protein, partial [Xanthomonas arboricola]|uniref:hypothetical protein n=1 Tax=Xanthomonas arboricola TaxID=56448 RepID=UPI001EFB5035
TTRGATSERGGASITRSDPTVHWHGKPLRNSPEIAGPKRIAIHHERPNIALGGITPAMKLAMAA